MKSLVLRFKPYGKDLVFNIIRKAKKGKGAIEDEVIYFNDISSMYKFMSKERLKLVSVIKNKKPQSIYELAQLVNKDQGYVSKELKFLSRLGVVGLTPDNSGVREKLIPTFNYDNIVFDVQIDRVSGLVKASGE